MVNYMLKVTFEYCDAYSDGEYKEQVCVVSKLQDAIDFYGLGFDCDYNILSIERV